MLACTVDIEKRASLIPKVSKVRSGRFCGSKGLDWQCDDLEDFADFYRETTTGRQTRSRGIRRKKILLNRSFGSIRFLERPRCAGRKTSKFSLLREYVWSIAAPSAESLGGANLAPPKFVCFLKEQIGGPRPTLQESFQGTEFQSGFPWGIVARDNEP
jgi:hypothetical protein